MQLYFPAQGFSPSQGTHMDFKKSFYWIPFPLIAWAENVQFYFSIISGIMWQVEPREHFFLESLILKAVYSRLKVIKPKHAPHSEIYVHI